MPTEWNRYKFATKQRLKYFKDAYLLYLRIINGSRLLLSAAGNFARMDTRKTE